MCRKEESIISNDSVNYESTFLKHLSPNFLSYVIEIKSYWFVIKHYNHEEFGLKRYL